MAEINADAVLQFAGVSVRRGQKVLLDSIDWTVELDERWVIIGPNGAGKTTLLQLAGALVHPTEGEAYVLGEQLGKVDVFELRPRIGFTSAALAQRMPGNETVVDIVISAGYAVSGAGVRRTGAWTSDARRSCSTLRRGRPGRSRISHIE